MPNPSSAATTRLALALQDLADGFRNARAGAMLAWLFPRDAASLTALVDQVGEARIWAGLHFRSDVVVGLVIGRTVAWKVIERTQPDGA